MLIHEDLDYIIEGLCPETENIIAVYARLGHIYPARAAFDVWCNLRPGELIILRLKARIIARSDR